MKVSIIVPVYNVEKYLPECLDSLVNQTLKDIEIICVNDGSTDNSLDILKKYSQKYSNIIVINQANKGLGATRNVGVSYASGEYIGYVDSDDFVDSAMFEKLYTVAKACDADVALTNFYIYLNDTGYVYPYRDMKLLHRLNVLGSFNAYQNPEVLLNVGCWDKLYKRSFLQQNNIAFPEKRIYEDVLYSYSSLTYANKIVALTDRLYYYRKNTGISITDNEIRNDEYKFDFLKNYTEIRNQWKSRPDIQKAFDEPVTFLQIRDGYFHNSNIKKKSTFKKFFLQMSELINELEANYIRSLKNETLTRYVNLLVNKDWKTFYNQVKATK